MVGGGFNQSKQSSDFVTRREKSLFGEDRARELGEELLGFARGFPPVQRTDISSPFEQGLEERLLSGTPPTLTAPQNEILKQAIAVTGGNQAGRGLTGRRPPTQTSLIGATAPLLANFFQQNTSNLQNALSGQQSARLNQQGLFQQGTQAQNELVSNILQQLISGSLDQIIGGNTSRGKSFGFDFAVAKQK